MCYATPTLFPTPCPCHDCGVETMPQVLAGVSVPLCQRCLAVVVIQAAGMPMIRAVCLDLPEQPVEYVRHVPVDAPAAVVEQAVVAVEAEAVEQPATYRRPVPRRVSLNQDNGAPGLNLLGMVASPAADPRDDVDRMDAMDALADVLSPYDLQRLRIFMRGGSSLPIGLAERVKKRVSLPTMCHLFGLPEARQSYA